LENLFQLSECIIFDLDGTLYEDTHHFQHYANLLKKGLVKKDQLKFQEDYAKMVAGDHIVKIGRVYDYVNDTILEVDSYTLKVTRAWDWNGNETSTVDYTEPIQPNFDTMIAIGDGWWPPNVCARHYGHSDPQYAYNETKVFMASEHFKLSKITHLREALLHLKNKRQIVLLTNSDSEDVKRLLSLLNLQGVFAEIVTSARKPELTTEHFKNLIDKFNLKPKEALSVGDNFLNEIAPAEMLGMKSIFIDSQNMDYPQYNGLKVNSISETIEMMMSVE